LCIFEVSPANLLLPPLTMCMADVGHPHVKVHCMALHT
jgi:hypothetical protein